MKKLQQIQQAVQTKAVIVHQQVKVGFRRFGLKIFLLLVAAFLLNQKDLSIDLNLSAAQVPAINTGSAPAQVQPSSRDDHPKAMTTSLSVPAQNTSLLHSGKTEKTTPEPKSAPQNVSTKQKEDNVGNTYSNMIYSVKEFATSESERAKAEKRKKQLAYVDRFVDVAQKEMARYGIPASITLAQGLLESNAGESKLAKRNNNHFGMKCFSRTCKKGHCSNFTDDTHKDFFRVYKSSWDSYRAHSLLLKNGDRYQRLFKLDKKDYKGWARGLKKAGYATDQYYAEKLINTIEDLQLYKYD